MHIPCRFVVHCAPASFHRDCFHCCHLQQSLSATGNTEPTQPAPAKRHTRVGRGNDQIVDDHRSSVEPGHQSARRTLIPEDRRGQPERTCILRSDRTILPHHV